MGEMTMPTELNRTKTRSSSDYGDFNFRIIDYNFLKIRKLLTYKMSNTF